MQVGEVQLADGAERILEHFTGLGREAGDQVGPENHVGARLPGAADHVKGIVPAVAALHAFENSIIEGLQAEVQVRHEAGLFGQQAENSVVDGRRVEGTEPEAFQVRHGAQNLLGQVAQAGVTCAIGRNINTGQHHFHMAALNQFPHLIDDAPGRHAAIGAAGKGDDAEGAAMVAALLHLDEGAGAAFQTADQVTGGFLQGHDIGNDHRFGIVGIGGGVELFQIADHPVDLGHGGEFIRLQLGGAAGDDDPGLRVVAPRLADGLAGLAFGFRRHCTGIDDHRVFEPGLGGALAHDLRFKGVEAATEGDDLGRTHNLFQQRRVKGAGETGGDCTGHHDVVVRQPVDAQRPPVEPYIGHTPGQAPAVGGNQRRTGSGAAGLGQPRAPFPDAKPDGFAVDDLGGADIGEFGEHLMVFDNRSDNIQRDGFSIVDEKDGVGIADVDADRVFQGSVFDAHVQGIDGF